eukprot:scaffold151841_cov33-Tisochrysis_lutea.AAC.2
MAGASSGKGCGPVAARVGCLLLFELPAAKIYGSRGWALIDANRKSSIINRRPPFRQAIVQLSHITPLRGSVRACASVARSRWSVHAPMFMPTSSIAARSGIIPWLLPMVYNSGRSSHSSQCPPAASASESRSPAGRRQIEPLMGAWSP